MVFDSAAIYIESCTDLRAKITAIDNVITALESMALTAAATGDLQEYFLDDGQTKIKTTYRDVNQVSASILGFMRIRETYVNKLNGRMARAMDGSNFR